MRECDSASFGAIAKDTQNVPNGRLWFKMTKREAQDDGEKKEDNKKKQNDEKKHKQPDTEKRKKRLHKKL